MGYNDTCLKCIEKGWDEYYQKKSKEERQKEREEKERQRSEMFKRPSKEDRGGDGERERKKRQRIKKDKIDINNPNVQAVEGGKKQKPQKDFC